MNLHSLEPKMMVVTVLYENLDSVIMKGDYMPARLGEITDPRRKTFAVMLSMQILALTIELIDDLAAYCFAFYRAKNSKNRLVAEYLRDWDTPDQKVNGGSEIFFNKVRDDFRYAAEMLGLRPVDDWALARVLKAKLTELGEFRRSYEKWYQGYKHGQRTLPVFTTPQGEQPLGQKSVWGIFMIPKNLTRYEQQGQQLYVDFDVSFLPLLERIGDCFQRARSAFELWREVRSRVHLERFGNAPL